MFVSVLCFYEEQYGEQTAVREIRVKTPQAEEMKLQQVVFNYFFKAEVSSDRLIFVHF